MESRVSWHLKPGGSLHRERFASRPLGVCRRVATPPQSVRRLPRISSVAGECHCFAVQVNAMGLRMSNQVRWNRECDGS